MFRADQVIGGYKGNWTVPWDKLQSANEIVLHTIAERGASDDELFALMLGISDFSKDLPAHELNLEVSE